MAKFSTAFEAIGTKWQVDFDMETDREAGRAMQAMRDRIDLFDSHYSRFRGDSLVARVSREAGVYTMPADFAPMYVLYELLHEKTGGAFTPLIGQTLSDAGYDAQYSLVPKTLHSPPSLHTVLSYREPELEVRSPALLDFGAAGKGHIVDLVAGILREAGARSYIVDAGGDIAVRQSSPVRIGLEHPADASLAIGIANMTDGCICGSSGSRRRWDKYHHILDPRTLESPRDIAAVWTVAESALLADALSTCLFFVSPHALSDFDFDYLILRSDDSVERSFGFPAELFT